MNGVYILSLFLHESRLYGRRPDGVVYEERAIASVDDFCVRNRDDSAWTDAAYGIIASPAFTDNELSRTVQAMRRAGFANVRTFNYNEHLAALVKAHRQALIMSADGDDLFMSLYDTASAKLLAIRRYKGVGRDPRVKVLAENIWRQVSDEAPYLGHDDSMPAIAKAAARFLYSGKAEDDGSVFLDGENRDYFVTRADARIDNSIDHGGASVLTALGTFTSENDIHKSDCVLVLSTGLAGNPYFETLLNGSFPDTMMAGRDIAKGIIADMMAQMAGDDAANGGNAIADELPSANIHAKATPDSISFRIDFPENVSAINVSRDGQDIRTLTTPEFTDTGLRPAHKYAYTFVVVMTGVDGIVRKSRGFTKEYSTTDIVLPAPSRLTVIDDGRSAVLTWAKTSVGETRVYVSPTPFSCHANDRIDVPAFHYDALRTLEPRYVVTKDFCGERFYLPVNVVGDVGVAGDSQRVVSAIPPGGVRIDSTVPGHVKVIWTWESIPGVRIRWTAADSAEQWRDVENTGGRQPEFELPLPPRSRDVVVSVTSIFKSATGETVESARVNLNVSLKPVKIEFTDLRKPSIFRRNKFTVTLKAGSEPPCDLYVLIGEGSVPLDLTNFRSYLTIPHSELATPSPKSFVVEYQRADKSVPLYFRIIAANRDLPVVITPETLSVH